MDFQETKENMLVVTIGIQMHGTTIEGNLDAETKRNFKNVRLLLKSGGLNPFHTCMFHQYFFSSNLNEIFRKNLDLSTYEIMRKATSGH